MQHETLDYITKTATGKKWRLLESGPVKVEEMSLALDTDPLTSQILSQRCSSLENAQQFLHPQIKTSMPNPFSLKGMEKLSERLTKAILDKEVVGISTDYDVDGATSAALMIDFLHNSDTTTDFYVPNRLCEGYGPTINGFKYFLEQNIKLVVCLDCGANAVDAIQFARNNGIEVLIIDHHQSDNFCDENTLHVNPNRSDDNSQLNYLAAVGVVFMTLTAIRRKLRIRNFYEKRREPDLLSMLDLVALGTICDVVPLLHFNRTLVSVGLKVLNDLTNVGIKYLSSLCSLKNINSHTIGYVLGPILNAGGRMGQPRLATEILCQRSHPKAQALAMQLIDLNNERKKLSLIQCNEAMDVYEKNHITRNEDFIYVSNDKWSVGILGLIAARMTEKYNLPAFVCTRSQDTIKSSARSNLPHVNLAQLMQMAKQQNVLLAGGGHQHAAGFSLPIHNEQLFIDFLKKNIQPHSPQHNNSIDNNKHLFLNISAYLSPSSKLQNTYNTIENIEPFGSANPIPLFLFVNTIVTKIRIFAQKHVAVEVNSIGDLGKNHMIAFNSVNTKLHHMLNDCFANQEKIFVVGELKKNTYYARYEVVIKDVGIL